MRNSKGGTQRAMVCYHVRLLTVGVDGSREESDSGREQHPRSGPDTCLLEGGEGGYRNGVEELVLGGGFPVGFDLVAFFRQAVRSVGAFSVTRKGAGITRKRHPAG